MGKKIPLYKKNLMYSVARLSHEWLMSS